MDSENSEHHQEGKSQEFQDQNSLDKQQQDMEINPGYIQNFAGEQQEDLFASNEQQQISREQEFLLQLKEKINLIEKYESVELNIKKKRQELENSLNFSILKQQYLITPQVQTQNSVSNKNVGTTSVVDQMRKSNFKQKSQTIDIENQLSQQQQQKQFAQYFLKMNQSPKDQIKQQQTLSEEYTFHPQLSRKSIKIYESQQKQAQQEDKTQQAHHEKLYRKSQTKQILQKQNKDEMIKQIKCERNITKMNKNSQKIIFKKIEQLLYFFITEHEDQNNKGYISQIKLGTLFQKLGIFKCFQDNDLNKTSLNMSSRYKTNTDRAEEEKIFLNEFWKILRLSVDSKQFNEENNELIKSALIFDFMIIFFDNNINPQKACLFLKEKLEYTRNFAQLQEKETLEDEEDKQDYHTFDFLLTEENDQGKVENFSNEFWSLNKLIKEFKKIFKDKTQFMEIYKNRKNLLNLAQQQEQQQFNSDEYKFAPNICEKSRLLDAQISDNYISRIIQQSGQNYDELRDNFNKNRYDMLYEHAKFFKEKKDQMIEQKNQEQLSQHTFKPYRESVKKSQQYEDYEQNEQQINNQIHEKLYKDGLSRKKNAEQKNKEKQKEKEVEESLKCTFQPQMMTKNSNLQKTLLEYSLNDVKGAYDAIERQYKGRDYKTEKEQAFKNLGQLKSIIQAEKSQALIESNQKSKKFQKYKQEKEEEGQEDQNNNTTDSTDQQEIHVDVNIAPGKVGKIIIKVGQNDPNKLAQEFSEKHQLKPEMIPTLENYLKQVIKQHTKKDQTNNEDDDNDNDEERKQLDQYDEDNNNQNDDNDNQQDEGDNNEGQEEDQNQQQYDNSQEYQEEQ